MDSSIVRWVGSLSLFTPYVGAMSNRGFKLRPLSGAPGAIVSFSGVPLKIGIYVARIHAALQRRPRYIISERYAARDAQGREPP